MSVVTKPNTFVNHTKIKAGELNENFDALFDTFNSFPSGKIWNGLASYTHWEFNYEGELWVSDKLFPVFYWSSDVALNNGSAMYGLGMIHQANTTVGTCTIALKQYNSGTTTTIDTITVASGCTPLTFNDTTTSRTLTGPSDGLLFYLDVTAVGKVPPANVTIFMSIASFLGS